MRCSRLLFFFYFILIHLAITPTFAQVCSDRGNYTANSTYKKNLDSLLASIYSNTQIDHGFYNFSKGENLDKVNAIALCRGDISPADCRTCVNDSSRSLLQSCPNQKEAILWEDKCMLRYSNRSIFNVMEMQPLRAWYNVGNISDVEGFNNVLKPLLNNLTALAASGNSTLKLALASRPAPDFQTIYSLVQCTPDLDRLDCSSCLQQVLVYIPQCCNGKQGGIFAAPSCVVRYEVYSFYASLLVAPASTQGYLIANPSTSWTNNLSASNYINFTDGSTVGIIFSSEFSESSGPVFACGFISNQTGDTYLFAIFILSYKLDEYDSGFEVRTGPRVVWSANQNNPVQIGATLQLTSAGGLVLKDANGTTAWSTNTSRKAVAGLNLTDMGNMVLLDENNSTIWQSFDHPTDSLLLGQKLMAGQKLISIDGGSFSLSVTGEGLSAFIGSNPPQEYFTYSVFKASYIKYLNGSLPLFSVEGENDSVFEIPQASSVQYMRLGPDGHLRVYGWDGYELKEVADLLKSNEVNCGYPTVCGNYGICTNDQYCSCPSISTNETTYFKQINNRRPDHGCFLITPLSCDASKNHRFLELENVTYFAFTSNLGNISSESCKKACLENCSCKAAIFRSDYSSFFFGECYLPSQLFSLTGDIEMDHLYKYTTYIKVQNDQGTVPLQRQTNRTEKTNQVAVILGSSLASLFGMFLFIGILVLLFWKKKDSDEVEEHYLDQVPGMPNRYSYEDLKAVTNNFNTKLGGGGFGSVFEGTLIDGIKVAVKRLDGFGQIKKSFLAEVETIGSIHHFNLVRLIGFCAEKSHRLLVYEYMSNGSLDKWIFYKTNECTLDWHQRKKIIADTAKGLAYLHEDCRQKIVHLDVKPGNVLLDKNFNAKVSDFGLSKLIDRDQSQVVTTMRGTPGYLAPEWLSSVITEKVDVYSFGVMTLEILCGRRNFESTQPEEGMHLLSLYKIKLEEEQLLDLVDKRIENIQLHGQEILHMMKVAAWCLQSDFVRRPSMSVVVKVILEGVMDVEDNLDYNFSSRPLLNTKARVLHQEVNLVGSIPPLASVLSAPR